MQSQENVLCLVFGSQNVGKTSLICKFAEKNSLQEGKYHTSWHNEGVQYNIEFKQLRIDTFLMNFQLLAHAQVYAFIYEVTSRHSFDVMIDHLKAMVEKDIIKDSARVVIVGNKADKPQRQVIYEQGSAYGTEIGSFQEFSANSEISKEQIYKAILATKSYSDFKNAMKEEQANDLTKETAPEPIPEVLSMPVLPFSIASPPQIEYLKKSQEFSHVLKLIVLGSEMVGKSQFCKRIASQPFKEQYINTIGLEFYHHYGKMGDVEFKFQVWQTSGSEKFASICNNYYRGMQIYIILYDITDILSFKHIQVYLERIQKYGQKQSQTQTVLIGNKADLISTRKISFQEGASFANQIGADFFELSSKQESEVKQCFLKIVEHYICNHPTLLIKK